MRAGDSAGHRSARQFASNRTHIKDTGEVMNTKHLRSFGLFALSLILSACSAIPFAATPIPTLSLDETSAKDFSIDDFEAVHAPVNGDANEYLIFGNIPVLKPVADLPSDLAVFLGRWEGYGYYPPVNKDRKVVLVIQEITPQGGTGYAWSGTNLQYPDLIWEVHFRIVQDETPLLEWQKVWPDGSKEIVTFSYDSGKDILTGWSKSPDSEDRVGPYELSRDKTFHVYKDYAKYLASKRIYPREYKNEDLLQYGKGYMVYLPEGYEDNPEKTWPLLFFLHGMGDRGDNLFVLPKASPFMMIREQGPMPFVIVAPLLNLDHSLFPNEYLDGALAEALSEYRVDSKRIYLTGMSMGGEAAYRFAATRADLFAAVAPLCGWMLPGLSIQDVEDLPMWVIHGSDDMAVPLANGQQAVDAFKQAGANVRFDVLQGYDHDVWTVTYSDPQFYEWFLQYQK